MTTTQIIVLRWANIGLHLEHRLIRTRFYWLRVWKTIPVTFPSITFRNISCNVAWQIVHWVVTYFCRVATISSQNPIIKLGRTICLTHRYLPTLVIPTIFIPEINELSGMYSSSRFINGIISKSITMIIFIIISPSFSIDGK